jgi:hypothetical protein
MIIHLFGPFRKTGIRQKEGELYEKAQTKKSVEKELVCLQ